MTEHQQQVLNQIFEEKLGIRLAQGQNISPRQVEELFKEYVSFEQRELTPEEWMNLLRDIPNYANTEKKNKP